MKFKKILWFIPTLFLLTGCTRKAANVDYSGVTLDHKIVLVRVRENDAWTSVFDVSFIDSEGRGYEAPEVKSLNEDNVAKMEAVIDGKGESLFSVDDMKYMVALAERIPENVQFDTEDYARDYGSCKLYYLQYDEEGHAKFVLIHSHGDIILTARDENASNLLKYYEKKVADKWKISR